jgi:membrane protein DedA with SNARE-associated domain
MPALSWARFTVFNLVGAALWVSSWGLGVYCIDLHLDGLVALIRRINPWMAAATVAVLGALAVLYWLKFYRGGDPQA